jgi:acyl-coenzyme A thioesterase PaaI-like protein
MQIQNKLLRVVSAINLLPRPARTRLLSSVLGRIVPFVATAGLVIEEMTESRTAVLLRNRRRVRNHIGGVHAAAMGLAVETATGFVVALNVPDSRVPLIKSLKVDYRRRTKGDLRAVATLSEQQRELIRTTEKGEVEVEVHATDESGEEPIRCTALWAWVPRKRRAPAKSPGPG